MIRRNAKRYAKTRFGKPFRGLLGIFDKAHPVGTDRTAAILKTLWTLLLDADMERRSATDYDPDLDMEKIEEVVSTNVLVEREEALELAAWHSGYEAGLSALTEEADEDRDEDRDDVNYAAPEITKADLDVALKKQAADFRRQLNSVKATNKSTSKPTPTTTPKPLRPRRPHRSAATAATLVAQTCVPVPTPASAIAPPNTTRCAPTTSGESSRILHSQRPSRPSSNDRLGV